jgi:TolB-like protein
VNAVGDPVRAERIGVVILFPPREKFFKVRCGVPRRMAEGLGIARARRILRTGWVLVPMILGAAGVVGTAKSQTKPTILLLPMVVHSSESPGYLRRGLSDMLMARFQQADQFVLIQVEDPAMATTQAAEAIEAGRNVGADFVLFGSFTRFGEGASLDMHAASTRPSGEEDSLREIFVHSGQIGEVIPDLADLVGKVTRFAIDDFSPVSPGENEKDSPAPGSRADLLQRVRALERAVDSLQKKGEEAQ